MSDWDCNPQRWSVVRFTHYQLPLLIEILTEHHAILEMERAELSANGHNPLSEAQKENRSRRRSIKSMIENIQLAEPVAKLNHARGKPPKRASVTAH